MTDVLLVTCAALPGGEPGGDLVSALERHAVSARWVVWDDPGVDWGAAGTVAVRSVWDYEHRREEFLVWARSLDDRLLNGARAFAWNTDKSYLADLAGTGLPVVPTLLAGDEADLRRATAAFGRAVVKPRVAASGRGVVVVDGESRAAAALDESRLEPGPWVVQPLVDSVRTEGETSVFVLGGEAVSQVRKLPARGEIRVHEEYGGSTTAVPLDDRAAGLARRAVAAAEKLLGTRLAYARADLMRLGDDTLAVSELELTEPGLYLDVLPGNADAFARAVAADC